MARRNFEFAGQCLCEIWLWIEHHTQICHYSLDVRKCSDQSCCGEVHAKEAIDLLKENNGFLLPLTKGKDGHYLNPIHILQYMDKVKLPKYDEVCPSLSAQMHQRLCCNVCDKYFPMIKMITNHKKAFHPVRHTSWQMKSLYH